MTGCMFAVQKSRFTPHKGSGKCLENLIRGRGKWYLKLHMHDWEDVGSVVLRGKQVRSWHFKAIDTHVRCQFGVTTE
jgi:hypothetical protein